MQKRGEQFDYNGSPAGYADQPDEVINYVDAHDNETLYDLSVFKLPTDTSMADRVRMNTLSLATVTLSQSPSFWHAGTELLRSKSLDRNSYNSGDWFNRIDWTGQESTFGSGLPNEADNGDEVVDHGAAAREPRAQAGRRGHRRGRGIRPRPAARAQRGRPAAARLGRTDRREGARSRTAGRMPRRASS